ncbi:MAG: UvrD-helicase domain-containing protein [Bacteroidales bacterium]|nr:UvrD-helicase domain-containing protein [Bacteroidales bacterium]MBN2818122.1 UvrD-helicase domain-containing protein [Bacteroidales bacterium]
MSSLFEGLNKAQTEAVKNTDGPSLVIAGAGSGKTRVLTYRIAHLLEKGVQPSKILALTFTNKAAKEMKERINRVLANDVGKYLWMGTFHSMFSRILRYESDKLGYPSDFTIYDTVDSKSLIKSVIKELKLDDKTYKPGEVLSRISSAKNNLITPQAYYNNEKIRQRDQIHRKPMIAEIFKLYASRCRRSGAMDFDDLLLNTNILFRDCPDVLRKYQDKFDYILVDEYQDTNYSQYLIVKKLGEKHQNVCVVGDDAQSIYSFRGAMIENILNFKNDYPGYNLYKLEQNYRSTKTIVEAANSIIEKNSEQIRKNVFSKNDEGVPITVSKALTDVEEGFIVSNSIFDTMLSEQAQYNDFAILYRTNAQSRIFEEALRKRNIPYKVYGSISFYQRKEIKDIISYLRMVINPNDDEALKRIINYPARGIGKTTMDKIESLAGQKEVSLWDILIRIQELNNILKLNNGTLTKLKAFVDFISEFQAKSANSDAYQIAQSMASESGILKDLHNGTTPEERSKYENLEELLNGIRDFVDASIEEDEDPTINRYLENVSLLTDTDNENSEDRNNVSIMTIHSAKGLEFKYVYIAGLEEELFPSFMSVESPKDLEEERRLFYVAVTRAMTKVNLTYALTRYKWGTPTDSSPSRFISEIDEKYIEWFDDPRKKQAVFRNQPIDFIKKQNFDVRPKFQSRQIGQNTTAGFQPKVKPVVNTANFNPDAPESIQQGMTVEHTRFGKGKVIHIEGDLPNRKATVFFHQIQQEKQLLLKFAKLRIVKEV